MDTDRATMTSMAGMVIYEVNLAVQQDVADEYRAWLESHIAEILQLDGFTSATCFHRDAAEEMDAGQDTVLLTVHYRLRDRGALQDYFDNHAARFRQDGLNRFAGKFTAQRRILYPARDFRR